MAGYLGSVPVPQATQHRESFTATEGQTSFATAGYTPQFVDVYLNGSHLSPADFTASNGSDVVLGVAASADDVCDIISYTPFEVADQTFTGTTTMDVAAITGVLTTTAATVFNGGFTSNGDTVTFTSANASDPLVIIKNTANDASGARLSFQKDKGANAADGDDIGTITFIGDNNAQEQTNFGSIVVEVSESQDTDEAGKMSFFVAESNGSASQLTAGLIIEGEHATDGQVDVTLAAGAASTTTVAGYLNVTSDLNVTGVSSFRDGTASSPAISNTGDSNTGIFFPAADTIAFGNVGAERVRIQGSDILMGQTTGNVYNSSSLTGFKFDTTSTANLQISRNAGVGFLLNRIQDGTIAEFFSAGGNEGSISISGSTTSYNAFSGSHWSRLADNSQPTILRGTLIETLDEMCDWYQAQFTIPATTKEDEDGETVEDTPENNVKMSIALPSGASVGDTISYTYEEVVYSATIIKEGDNKHPKCKISDTADSIRVYGVFATWDNDDDTVNDMYVTAVGTHVVRVHGGQTVSAGDLLVSNGDGTAKVQDDDIIRSKTLGKVLTNIKQETYADDSYTVPCALYCG